jgi:F-type H+-transporting ATPase subunit epsilon
MELEIITPVEILDFSEVSAIHAEGAEGCFTILPRHADYVSSVAPSIFAFECAEGERYFGVDGGVLVKTGGKVRVSVRHAVRGGSLEDLRERMSVEFRRIDDGEKKARRALASLGSGIAKLMVELKEARA